MYGQDWAEYVEENNQRDLRQQLENKGLVLPLDQLRAVKSLVEILDANLPVQYHQCSCGKELHDTGCFSRLLG